MSYCENSKSIVLVRGDDTNFNDQVFLTLRLNTTILDLANSSAKFILGDIVKTYDDLSSGVIEVNYKSSETSTFPEGKLNGVLRIYDRLKRRGTIESYIPFCVVSNVSGNAIATKPFEMTINVEQGGENILNIDVEAGVSVEVGTTTTLPAGSDATVTNSGTPNHLVLNFGIPEGQKGEQGPEGPEGPEGPAGKDGADGKDAKINGVNTLTLNATNGLTLTQSGNVATISGKTIQESVTSEALNRSNADTDLQRQIDAIVASSDVTDIVGTYAQLLAYDTSTLPPNSIIKVLQDESRDNETTYYRWVITEGVGSWVLIGEEGPYYTKSEADGKFVPKTTTINGKALSGDISLDASDVGAATSAQGAKADTAIQPNDLGTAAYSSTTDFATASQGAKADTAVQPGDLGSAAYENANSFATSAQGAKADTAVQPAELNNYLPIAGGNITGDLSVKTNLHVGDNLIKIPDEYTLYDYVQTNNQAYFNTGYRGNNDSEYEIEFEYLSMSSSGYVYPAILGDRTTTSAQIALTPADRVNGTGASNNRWASLAKSWGRDIGIAAGYTYHAIMNKEALTVKSDDDPSIAVFSLRFDNSTTFTTGSNITIGYINNTDFRSNIKIKNVMIIRENGVEVRRYYPVKRNSDGEFGLYDVINNTFLTKNPGAGSITGGNVRTNQYTINASETNAIVFSDNGDIEIKNPPSSDDKSNKIATTKNVRENLDLKYDRAGGNVLGDVYFDNNGYFKYDYTSTPTLPSGSFCEYTEVQSGVTPTYAMYNLSPSISAGSTVYVKSSVNYGETGYIITSGTTGGLNITKIGEQFASWNSGTVTQSVSYIYPEYKYVGSSNIEATPNAVKIYEIFIVNSSGVVTHHWLPWNNGTDGRNGFYDIINNTGAYRHTSGPTYKFGPNVTGMREASLGTMNSLDFHIVSANQKRMTFGKDGSVKLTTSPSSGATGTEVVTAEWVGNKGYLTGINSSMVTTALGYSPVNPSSLATVATSGAYSDLSGKPTIPTVNNPTITITQGGDTKGSFTLNQSGNQTIALDGGSSGDYLPIAGGNITGDLSVKTNVHLGDRNKLNIPSEYTLYDYVQTNNKAWFDTGYYGNKESEYELDFVYLSMSEGSSVFPSVFGDRTNQSKNSTIGPSERISGAGNNSCRWGSASVSWPKSNGIAPNYRYKVVINKSGLTATSTDDTSFSPLTLTMPYTDDFTTQGTIAIGKINGIAWSSNIKVHGCKVKEDGVLLHQYYPVKRNSDDAFGLYDIVENEFLTNANSVGSITGGSEAQLPDVPGEYIINASSTNGIVLTEDGRVELKKDVDKTDSSNAIATTKMVNSSLSEKYSIYGGTIIGDVSFDNNGYFKYDYTSTPTLSSGSFCEYTEIQSGVTPMYAMINLSPSISAGSTVYVKSSIEYGKLGYIITSGTTGGLDIAKLGDQLIGWNSGTVTQAVSYIYPGYTYVGSSTIVATPNAVKIYEIFVVNSSGVVTHHWLPWNNGTDGRNGFYDVINNAGAFINTGGPTYKFGPNVTGMREASFGTMNSLDLHIVSANQKRMTFGKDGSVKLTTSPSSGATGTEVVTAEWVLAKIAELTNT